MVRSPKRGPSMAKKATGALPLTDNRYTVRLSGGGYGWNAHDPESNDDSHGVGVGEREDLLSEHANGKSCQDYVHAVLDKSKWKHDLDREEELCSRDP